MVTRCPFTISLFIGTAALVIYHQRQKKKQKQTEPPVFSLPPSEVVFVLGAPGTGKGTQCQLLQSNLGGNWIHLSAGDLLREARDSGTGELADLIRAKMQAGEIVPSSVTVGLLEEAMTKAFLAKGSRKFLIDGFPRSHENLDAWEAAMTAHTVSFVLNFECPEEVLYVTTMNVFGILTHDVTHDVTHDATQRIQHSSLQFTDFVLSVDEKNWISWSARN